MIHLEDLIISSISPSLSLSHPLLSFPPLLLLSFFLSSSLSLSLCLPLFDPRPFLSGVILISRMTLASFSPQHFYLFYFTNCATTRFFFFSFSSELTRSKQSWNKAELAAELLSHIPTSIGTHFFLPAHTRITFYQHSINLSPRWENGHAIVLQPAIVFGLNASQPACAFFFFPLSASFFSLWFNLMKKLPSVATEPALYMAEGNKVWQLHGTNDWITLSHCQGVILTLNKGKRRKCGMCVYMCARMCVCVCQRASPQGTVV